MWCVYKIENFRTPSAFLFCGGWINMSYKYCPVMFSHASLCLIEPGRVSLRIHMALFRNRMSCMMYQDVVVHDRRIGFLDAFRSSAKEFPLKEPSSIFLNTTSIYIFPPLRRCGQQKFIFFCFRNNLTRNHKTFPNWVMSRRNIFPQQL
jgi:hypothetical protein